MEQIERSFFFVGINEYTHSDRELRGCINDVIDGLGFLLDIHADMSRVVVCTSPLLTAAVVARAYAGAATDPDHGILYADAMAKLSAVTFCRATRRAILEDAAAAFQRIPDTHNIAINWSGHGQLIDGVYHLAPSDAVGQYEAGAAQSMLRYRALLHALGAHDEDSVLAVLDTCDAGSVMDADYADRPQDLILTSGGPAQEISERYIGGQWRGLLIWSFYRVLEQYNIAHGAASGIEVAYGTLLRDVRVLAALFQGAESTPAVAQLHGQMANAPSVLHLRVGQTFALPPGRTSYRAEFFGGEVQMWTDVGDVGLYKLDADGVSIAYVLVNGGAAARTVHVQPMGTVSMKAKDEMWFFDATKMANLPVSPAACSFSLVETASTPFHLNASLTGFSAGSLKHIAMLPQWGTPSSVDTTGFLNLSPTATYAFRITATQSAAVWNVSLRWLKSSGAANPFRGPGNKAQSAQSVSAMNGMKPNLLHKSYDLSVS